MRRYIADLHFFDEPVCFQMDHRPFASVQEMNAYMITQWNNTVKRGDEIFVLGDMFNWRYTNAQEINKVLHQLQGKIYLILGNHDINWFQKSGVDQSRFKWIHQYAEINDCNRKVILCHYPIPFFNQNHVRDKQGELKTFMLHGHVHASRENQLLQQFKKLASSEVMVTAKGKEEAMTCNMFNCFCGFSDYRPLSLDEWIRNSTEEERR